MTTLFRILSLFFSLGLAFVAFVIFAGIEIYVIDIVDIKLQSLGYASYSILGWTVSELLWAACVITIIAEFIILCARYSWGVIRNIFIRIFR